MVKVEVMTTNYDSEKSLTHYFFIHQQAPETGGVALFTSALSTTLYTILNWNHFAHCSRQ